MPGCSVSLTTESFCSVVNRRRRATPVMTSTFENVSDIGVCLGLCLAPPANAGVRSKRGAVQTGKTTEAFGSNPKGYFMFDAANHFSINLMRPGRPKFARRDFPVAGESDAALEGIVVMFGDYKINEPENSISLHIIGSSFPAWDNTNQTRLIAINGDELTYKNPTPASGGGTALVTLKRAASATE